MYINMKILNKALISGIAWILFYERGLKWGAYLTQMFTNVTLDIAE